MDRFGYFMVRLQSPGVDATSERGGDADGDRLGGVVERLATGEKRAFASGTELLRLLRAWPAAGPAPDRRAVAP